MKTLRKIVLFLCIPFIFVSCGAPKNTASEIVNNKLFQEGAISEIAATDLKSLVEGESNTFILYVYGANCGYCKTFTPILDSYVAEKKIANIVKIVVDTNEANFVYVDGLVTKGLSGWPALYVVRDGKVVDESVGLIEKEALHQFFKKNSDSVLK